MNGENSKSALVTASVNNIMLRAVGVLIIFITSPTNCFPDLTPEAVTVYRNPEFFKNLYYYGTEKYEETSTETSPGTENYKYPGETTKPNQSGDSPGFGVTYDDSPEFHHEPRDISQSPFRPSRRKGPYGPLYDVKDTDKEDVENISEENTAENSEEASQKNESENPNITSKESIREENSEENFKKNSEDDSDASQEEHNENVEEDLNEFGSRTSNRKTKNSEEPVEESLENSQEEESPGRSGDEEEKEDDNKEEARQENDYYNSSENNEEIQTTSPHTLVTPDEELETKKEPTLLAQPYYPGQISDLSKTFYNQPYPFNASNPILYDSWKYYNYPKISNRNFIKSDVASPLYSEEPSSNLFNTNKPSLNTEKEDDNDGSSEESSDSFEHIDTKDIGADTKHIHKKLLRHKKLKPSLLLKYHSKPKLKKLKLKLKKGKHYSAWFDEYPFNF